MAPCASPLLVIAIIWHEQWTWLHQTFQQHPNCKFYSQNAVCAVQPLRHDVKARSILLAISISSGIYATISIRQPIRSRRCSPVETCPATRAGSALTPFTQALRRWGTLWYQYSLLKTVTYAIYKYTVKCRSSLTFKM